jgi:hypothetical protein
MELSDPLNLSGAIIIFMDYFRSFNLKKHLTLLKKNKIDFNI